MKRKFQILLGKLPSYIKNRYTITILLFIIWMLFFDRNDFISAIKMKLELSRLEEQQEYYKQELQNTKQIQKAIFEHNENLEKFAREKFYMKKDDELLYVIVEE